MQWYGLETNVHSVLSYRLQMYLLLDSEFPFDEAIPLWAQQRNEFLHSMDMDIPYSELKWLRQRTPPKEHNLHQNKMKLKLF